MTIKQQEATAISGLTANGEKKKKGQSLYFYLHLEILGLNITKTKFWDATQEILIYFSKFRRICTASWHFKTLINNVQFCKSVSVSNSVCLSRTGKSTAIHQQNCCFQQ